MTSRTSVSTSPKSSAFAAYEVDDRQTDRADDRDVEECRGRVHTTPVAQLEVGIGFKPHQVWVRIPAGVHTHWSLGGNKDSKPLEESSSLSRCAIDN